MVQENTLDHKVEQYVALITSPNPDDSIDERTVLFQDMVDEHGIEAVNNSIADLCEQRMRDKGLEPLI